MNTITIPRDAESLMLYLMNHTMESACSIEALHREYPGAHRVESTLAWLVEFNLVSVSEEGYELTFTGLQQAQQVQARAQAAQLLQDATLTASTIDTKPMTSLDTNPLRHNTAHVHAASDSQTLHFLLAFATPKNVLPAPLMDGDVLGRSPDTDICLSNDNCISAYHCRFYVEQRDNKTMVSIEDLGSHNGTYVNQSRLVTNRVYPLQHGSRIQIGNTRMIVVQIPN